MRSVTDSRGSDTKRKSRILLVRLVGRTWTRTRRREGLLRPAPRTYREQ